MKPTPTSRPDSLLVFGAHPDDIEFGCGGIIAAETQAGRRAHFVVGSRGESGTHGTPAQRTAEARTAAALLGATVEFIELGGDAHFEPRVEHALKLAALIRQRQPEMVLAPTVVENQHPDHAVLGRLVRDAARLARYGGVKELRRWPAHAVGQVVHYALTTEAEPRDQLPVFVDVSAAGVARAWEAAMRAHHSQAKTRDYAGFQLRRAEANGHRCGVRLAIPLFPGSPLIVDGLGAISRGARKF